MARPQADGVLLLCLDAMTLSPDSDRTLAPPDPAWRDNAARLRTVLTGSIRPEVVLCGVSANGSGLATALDAIRLGLRLTLASDAVGLTPGEQPGLEGLMRLQRMGHLPSLVRQGATVALVRPWRPLIVVKGGRR